MGSRRTPWQRGGGGGVGRWSQSRPARSARSQHTCDSRTLCSVQSRCEGLVSSLFIRPSPSDAAWLFISCFSEPRLFVFQAPHSSLSLCPSLHFRPPPPSVPRIILHLLQITHQLRRPSTNPVTMAPADGNFLWSCPVIGGETSKQRTAGEGWYITERLHFHFQGCLVNAPNPASGRK